MLLLRTVVVSLQTVVTSLQTAVSSLQTAVLSLPNGGVVSPNGGSLHTSHSSNPSSSASGSSAKTIRSSLPTQYPSYTQSKIQQTHVFQSEGKPLWSWKSCGRRRKYREADGGSRSTIAEMKSQHESANQKIAELAAENARRDEELRSAKTTMSSMAMVLEFMKNRDPSLAEFMSTQLPATAPTSAPATAETTTPDMMQKC